MLTMKEKADQIRATMWARKASDEGDASAQFRFATMLLDGRGVPKDNDQAAKWLRKAAQQGHPDAQRLLDNRSGIHLNQVARRAS